MSNGGKYLLRDGKFYYFRIRVPNALRKQIKSRQIKKSLKTDDLSKAQRLAEILHAYVILLFKKMEDGMLSQSQAQNLLDEYIGMMLEKHEEGLSLREPGVNWSREQAVMMGNNYKASIASLKNSLAENDLSIAGDFVTWLKTEKGIELESQAEENKLKREFLKKSIRAFEICLERIVGNYNNNFDIVSLRNTSYTDPGFVQFQASSSSIPSEHQISSGHKLGPLLDDFFYEHESSGKWRPNTAMEKKGQMDLFKEYFGEKCLLDSIKRGDILDFRENVLKNLPLNRKKNKKTRNLSLEEQLHIEDVEKIQIKTINEYLTSLSSFFNWCVELNYLNENVAKGLLLRDTRNPNEKRFPFTMKELTNILEKLSKVLNPDKRKDEDKLWIILLSLFQGMRANELCQLQVNNIVRVRDVPCIKATTSDDASQNLKARSSFRTIPIHKVILEFGFLNFVNARRKKMEEVLKVKAITPEESSWQKQLFLFCTYSKSTGKYTKNFLNFFGFFKSQYFPESEKSFHCFRHNFTTELSHSCKVPFIVSYLDGHQFKTETDKTYTHEDMEKISVELNKLDYKIDIFSIFGKTPLTEEQISEQIRKLPEDDSIFSYT